MGNALLFDFRRAAPKPEKLPAGQRATVIRFPGAEREQPWAMQSGSVAPLKPAQRARAQPGASAVHPREAIRLSGKAAEAARAAEQGGLCLPPRCAKDQRQAMLAKIHIALEKLRNRLEGFSEDVYRYTLGERWGVDSAAQMNIHQLDEVLAWLAELGFQSNRPFYARRDYRRWGPAALIEKINALLAEKRSKEGGRFLGMEYAEGILKRQTGGEADNVYKATPKQLRAVIAALDKDASRKGRKVR